MHVTRSNVVFLCLGLGVLSSGVAQDVNLDFDQAGFSRLSGTGNASSGNNAAVGSEWLFENVNIGTGMDVDAIVTILELGADSKINRIEGHDVTKALRIQLSSTDTATDNPFVRFSVSFWDAEGGTGTQTKTSAATLNNLTLNSYDIDSQPDRDFTDSFGYQTSLAPAITLSDTTLLVQQDEPGNPAGFTSYRLPGAVDASSDGIDWTPELNDDINDDSFANDRADYSVRMLFSSFSSGEFLWSTIGEDSSNQNAMRGMFLDGSNPSYIVVPEPGSLVLSVLAGLVGLVFSRRFS